MSGPTDPLARYKAGDESALLELAESMGPRLLGFFRRMGAQSATAEDLTQDVFVRALRGVSRYQPSGRMDSWFLRIARNLWIDHCRRHRAVTGREDWERQVGDQVDPSEQAAQTDRAAQIRAIVHATDPATRELLELAVLQKLPYAEVSSLLDIPVGTVKSRVHYALRRLRDQLAGHPLGDA